MPAPGSRPFDMLNQLGMQPDPTHGTTYQPGAVRDAVGRARRLNMFDTDEFMGPRPAGANPLEGLTAEQLSYINSKDFSGLEAMMQGHTNLVPSTNMYGWGSGANMAGARQQAISLGHGFGGAIRRQQMKQPWWNTDTGVLGR